MCHPRAPVKFKTHMTAAVAEATDSCYSRPRKLHISFPFFLWASSSFFSPGISFFIKFTKSDPREKRQKQESATRARQEEEKHWKRDTGKRGRERRKERATERWTEGEFLSFQFQRRESEARVKLCARSSVHKKKGKNKVKKVKRKKRKKENNKREEPRRKEKKREVKNREEQRRTEKNREEQRRTEKNRGGGQEENRGRQERTEGGQEEDRRETKEKKEKKRKKKKKTKKIQTRIRQAFPFFFWVHISMEEGGRERGRRVWRSLCAPSMSTAWIPSWWSIKYVKAVYILSSFLSMGLTNVQWTACLWSFVFLRSRLVLAVHTVQARHARALSQKLFWESAARRNAVELVILDDPGSPWCTTGPRVLIEIHHVSGPFFFLQSDAIKRTIFKKKLKMKKWSDN